MKRLDKAFRCPLCSTRYGSGAEPAALPCGHACCFSHIKDIKDCPQCHHALKRKKSIAPCTTLLEAANSYYNLNDKFQALMLEKEQCEQLLKVFKSQQCSEKVLTLEAGVQSDPKRYSRWTPPRTSPVSTPVPLPVSVPVEEVKSSSVISVSTEGSNLDADWVLDMELHSNSTSVVSTPRVPAPVAAPVAAEDTESDFDEFLHEDDQSDKDSPATKTDSSMALESTAADVVTTSQSTSLQKKAWTVPGQLAKRLSDCAPSAASAAPTTLPASTPSIPDTSRDEEIARELAAAEGWNDDDDDLLFEQENFEQLPFRERSFYDYIDGELDAGPEYADFFGSYGEPLPPLQPNEPKRMRRRKGMKHALTVSAATTTTTAATAVARAAAMQRSASFYAPPNKIRRSNAPKIGRSRTVQPMASFVNKMDAAFLQPVASLDLASLKLGEFFAEPPHSSKAKSSNLPKPGHVGAPATPKACGHWCSPSSTSCCCHCADRRPYPKLGKYKAYIDGTGYVDNADRSAMYCPVCSSCFC